MEWNRIWEDEGSEFETCAMMMRSGKVIMIMERRKNRINVAGKVPVGIVGQASDFAYTVCYGFS